MSHQNCKRFSAFSLLALVALWPCGLNLQAADSSSLEPYQIILQRNIFDPNRRPPTPPRSAPPPQRAPNPDSFTLLGTLISPKTTVAFFEGSGRDLTRSVRVGDSIGGHEIVSIEFDKVALKLNQESLSLEVGQTRIRNENEPWQTQADRPSYASSRARPESSSSESAPSAQESTSDDPNDILQQLMKRRKEQLSQ